VEIPVWYHPRVGPDLEELAREKKLSLEELISIHTEPDYLVYMLGFKPGFPFLGGLDERLWTPRLATPRLDVAAGSVGIGGQQTGIYSVRSPGGWRILGRTPFRLFDPHRENCFLIMPGDRVRFFSIEEREYLEMLSREEKLGTVASRGQWPGERGDGRRFLKGLPPWKAPRSDEGVGCRFESARFGARIASPAGGKIPARGR
jgi:allophanate hydrolase subunit 1